MPTVPIFTAQATGPRQRTPNYIPSGGIEQQQQIVAGEIGKLGKGFAEIGGKIKAQQEETELIGMGATYDAGIRQIHLNLAQDQEVIENPDLYSQKFLDQSKELVAGIGESASNDRLKNTFFNHVDKKYPLDLVEATAIQQKKQVQHANATTAVILSRLSDLASTASPNDMKTYLDIGNQLVDNAWKRGFYPDEMTKMKVQEGFQKSVLEKNFNYLAATDPETARAFERGGRYSILDSDTRLKILKRAQETIDDRDRRAAQATEEVRKSMDRQAASAALNGTLTPEFIQDAKNDNNPYITPTRAAELEKIQENSPNSYGNQQLQAIHEKYRTTFPMTKESILATQKEVLELANGLERKNPHVSQFLDKLQTDWNTVVNQDTALIAATGKAAKDDMTATRPPIPPSRILTRMEDALRKREDAELDLWIRQNPGKDYKTKMNEIMKRREDRYKNAPALNKIDTYLGK